MKMPSIPWKRLARQAWELVMTVLRAKANEPPRDPKEPGATEAFDQWKDGTP